MKALRVVMILVLIIGLGVLLFPQISQKVYDHKVEGIIEEFEETMNQPEYNARLEELYRFLVSENERMYAEGQKDLKDPFSYEVPGIDLSQYGIQDNVIGHVEIPKLDLHIPIYLGANKENMTLGAVHLTQTSYPVGGNNTNCVLAAHRGYDRAQMFRHLDKLVAGDVIYVHNFRETLTYRVDEIKVVEPEQGEVILIQDNRDLLTLQTCHPYLQNHQRYLVFAERVQ